MKIWSFEETIAFVLALAAAIFAYRMFKATFVMSLVIGMMVVVAIGYLTFFEFTLHDDVIKYRNRFREVSFPVSHVEKVSIQTFWGGLPGHIFMFLMHRPPAAMNGQFFRTGLFLWPSGSGWVDAVNTAIRRSASNSN